MLLRLCFSQKKAQRRQRRKILSSLICSSLAYAASLLYNEVSLASFGKNSFLTDRYLCASGKISLDNYKCLEYVKAFVQLGRSFPKEIVVRILKEEGASLDVKSKLFSKIYPFDVNNIFTPIVLRNMSQSQIAQINLLSTELNLINSLILQSLNSGNSQALRDSLQRFAKLLEEISQTAQMTAQMQGIDSEFLPSLEHSSQMIKDAIEDDSASFDPKILTQVSQSLEKAPIDSSQSSPEFASLMTQTAQILKNVSQIDSAILQERYSVLAKDLKSQSQGLDFDGTDDIDVQNINNENIQKIQTRLQGKEQVLLESLRKSSEGIERK